jgi:ubiquinone/menaquinone biosynthesis C-methylase UbiE
MKFDLANLEKLNDPGRFETLPPDVLWRALGEPVGARTIVEVGAGTGLFAAEFARLAPQATVYAADTAPQMLDWMRDHRPEVAAGRIVPVEASETSVPLPNGVADVLYMINLHHELARPQASYAEAFRLLREGGRLLVVDWADRDTPKGPPRAVRARTHDLVAMLEAAGFADVSADETTLPWHLMIRAQRP